LILCAGLGAATPLAAQRLLDATPNTRPAWTMGRWEPALVLSHRFEFVSGGDELLNLPLVTVGTAVHDHVAVGFDFTSNSETAAAHLGGNEAQWWLAVRGPTGARGHVSGLVAYNSAAGSVDGAVTARARTGWVSWVAEARGFSDAFGAGGSGAAGAGGVILHLTPYLAVGGDVGQAFGRSALGTVWSGGVTLAVPGTRHQFSFHAANSGAATLQGASRPKVLGPGAVRYGFAFVAPLGSGAQWARIFRRGEPATAADAAQAGSVRVDLRDIAFKPDTVRVRVGDAVHWVNGDLVTHTVEADDGSWTSGDLRAEQRYTRTFTTPGSFPYHCGPHPHMRGVVIVAPAGP
jgi:plastocyanin